MEIARVAGTLGHWESLRESGNAGTEGKRAGVPVVAVKISIPICN